MPVDLATAQRLITQRQVQPPAGYVPGTPAYNQWAVQWLQGAVDAGDPAAMQAAGVGTPVADQDQGYTGIAATGQGGAPTSEWLGIRKPTPDEVVRYYREVGRPEDFARFSAGQVAAWIQDKWNVEGGYFTNDFGDRVDKPTESGPRSRAAGYATGEGPENGGFRVGVGGGGGGAGASLGGPVANELFRLWARGAGAFGGDAPEGGTSVATQLPGGGLWWGTQGGEGAPAPGGPPGGAPPAGTPGGAPAAAPTGGTPGPVTPAIPTPVPGIPGGGLAVPPASTSPLTSALMQFPQLVGGTPRRGGPLDVSRLGVF